MATVASFEFKPKLNEDVVRAALAIFPKEVLPTKGDTPEKLAARIAAANLFDELDPLKGGNGPKRVRLNETTYSQTRRINYSTVVEERLDENGELRVRKMYAYGKPNTRIRTDLHATPMPWEVFELGVQCFLAVRHVLSEVCASSPPNHCQVLGYYALFKSKTGRHKDDHAKDDLHDVLLKRATVDAAVMRSVGAMVPGSDVLIYCAGPLPVLFSWCFTNGERTGHFVERELHETHPYMQLDLYDGSLFVFKAVDDLYFYHEVDVHRTLAKITDYRFAFVFRWLGTEQERDFPA